MQKPVAQILMIDNGFMVMTPPSERVLHNSDEQPQPVSHYCADYNEVVNYLKSVWPLKVK